MDLNRRTFVQTVAAGTALAASSGHSALAQGAKVKAVAFDAYGTLFDVYFVGQLAEKLFPGQGNAISQQGSRIRVCGPIPGVGSETYGPPDALLEPAKCEANKRPQRRLRACF